MTVIILGNKISHSGIKSLSEMLSMNTSITELNISCIKHLIIRSLSFLGPDLNIGESFRDVTSGLKANNTLTSLRASSNSIGPEGVAALNSVLLSNNSKLRELFWGNVRLNPRVFGLAFL